MQRRSWLASAAAPGTEAAAEKMDSAQYHDVDIASLELVRPRTVGVEHVGLWAMAQLGFVETLNALGLSAVQSAAVMGNVIGRMAAYLRFGSSAHSVGSGTYSVMILVRSESAADT
jgi:hypothetical protein